MNSGVHLASAVLLVAGIATCHRSEPAADREDASIASALRASLPPRVELPRDSGVLPPGVPEWARQSCGTNRNGDRFGAADLLRVARTVAAETGDELAVELAAQEYQLADHEMSAEALERNADRYRCHFGVFEGEVVEIQDVPGGGSVLQLRMPRTRAQLVAFAFVAPAASVVRGTTARVYGFGAGLQTSTDRALTLPRIDATAVVPNSVERHPSEATVRAVNAARTQR